MMKVLIPFDRREAITVRQAAKIAGRSESTIKGWCAEFWIGRRVVGGPWQVSRVALAMLLDGSEDALRAYLSGDRTGSLVTPYFEAIGAQASRSHKLIAADAEDASAASAVAATAKRLTDHSRSSFRHVHRQ